jgi:hypothetical protein
MKTNQFRLSRVTAFFSASLLSCATVRPHFWLTVPSSRWPFHILRETQ